MGITVKPFHLDLTLEEIEYFKEECGKILRSGTLVLGEYTARFEEAFARFIGARHAVSVNSGSTALEILLRLKGAENKTILVPTNTNFATIASILRAGGKVQYLDMDKATFAPTLQMVMQAYEKNPALGGLLWVHIGGVISPEFPEVVRYCRKHNLFVLEDSAHAHGSQLHGTKAGNLADGGAFSFFPTKVMTTGEGGMITTNNENEACLAQSFRNQGKRGANYGGLHQDFGNSSRMTEINALLGFIHLKKLVDMLKKRQKAYDIIVQELDKAGIPYVSTRHMERASQYKLIVLIESKKEVKEIKKKLIADGVVPGGGVYEIPSHRQPVFQGVGAEGSYPVAETWCPSHICPPLTSGMTEEEALHVGKILVKHLCS